MNFLRKLMYGRYGSDQLNLFLLIACLLCWILCRFVKVSIVAQLLSVVGYVLILYSLYRTFSRNYDRRRAENNKFLSITDPLTRNFRRMNAQARIEITSISAAPPAASCCGSPRGRGASTSPAATAVHPLTKRPDWYQKPLRNPIPERFFCCHRSRPSSGTWISFRKL